VKSKEISKPEYYRPIITKAIKSGFEGLGFRYDGVTEHFGEELRSANIRLYILTVNDPDVAVYMKILTVE
jgi:hypothetical protein